MFRVSNSATLLGPDDRGAVVVCGSHGGLYPAYLAARAGVRAVLLSDAGRGRDNAGIAGLTTLGGLGIAAAAISVDSARIGDGPDMVARGIVSVANDAARAVGCAPGMSCAAAAELLATAPLVDAMPPACQEARSRLHSGPLIVTGLDSIALVGAEDIGTMVVSGSHGGLIGAVRSAVKVNVLAAVYHDAGGGIDGAGYSRLPALDQLGIIGATVDGMTARIGDARSIWATGILSHCNAIAQAAGIAIGMRVRDMADRLEFRLGAPQADAKAMKKTMTEKMMRGSQP